MNFEVGGIGKALEKSGRCRPKIGEWGGVVAVVLPIIGGEEGESECR